MRVLITGGAGFIGSHVAERLITAGHEVRLLDNLLPSAHGTSAREAHTHAEDLVVGDVRDPEVIGPALSGIDAVCHHAAMVGLETGPADTPAYVEHNDLGTARLLSAMTERRVERLVLAGSMVVYGEGRYHCAVHGVVRPGPRAAEDLDRGVFEPRCPHCGGLLESGRVPEDAPTDPRNVYATTKLTQEHLVASWARQTGGHATALRYHNVYGPRMPRDTPYAGVAALFRSALARGEAPRVFEDGGQRRDFVNVRDVAEANLATLEHPPRGFAAYNVCSGEPRTIGEMARELATATGGPEPVVSGQYRLGDVRHIVADPELAAKEIGFRARIGFTEGITEFANAAQRGTSD
ncbi:dTDP-L-rhamnose 4-epimerase [Actinopolyspora lacussalsi subsp. righensis]|uniref:dTDP-L-rhamnose 4-epimerase n=1 Tax=Actinopolyspora righensis TaxID=995060 RepID=A0A1I7BJB0_9ACTN|nr:NAD-dependent epimerase/dehydratase family protein [Actinopolyspora righensis]SFT87201.1 dTDP-L-rhamnose 4-epimerase [Actinopolyspora righensis]